MLIREAVASDARALAIIFNKSWQAAYPGIIPAEELRRHTTLPRRYRLMKQFFARPHPGMYIAVLEDQPCGLVMLGPSRDADLPDYGEIIAFYFLPECWGRGLAQDLMTFSLQILRQEGYSHILLWVLKDNARARRFYEKQGFAADGKSRAEKFSNRPLTVRYRLHLAQRETAEHDGGAGK